MFGPEKEEIVTVDLVLQGKNIVYIKKQLKLEINSYRVVWFERKPYLSQVESRAHETILPQNHVC